MGIKPKFTKAMIQQELNQWREKVEEDLIQIMQLAGERFVKEARDMRKKDGGFDDDSGNLRSSIGYFIMKDGEIIDENLTIMGKYKFALQNEGMSEARNVPNEIDRKEGFQLIGVAGMDYASKVESNGYNVITAQADAALINLDKMLTRYAKRLNRLGVSFENTGDSVLTEMR